MLNLESNFLAQLSRSILIGFLTKSHRSGCIACDPAGEEEEKHISPSPPHVSGVPGSYWDN